MRKYSFLATKMEQVLVLVLSLNSPKLVTYVERRADKCSLAHWVVKIYPIQSGGIMTAHGTGRVTAIAWYTRVQVTNKVLAC